MAPSCGSTPARWASKASSRSARTAATNPAAPASGPSRPCKLRDTFAGAGWALKGTKLDGFYLAEERDGKLVYAGKIEGGRTEEEKNDLLARIKPYQQRNAPIELATAKPKAQRVEPRVLVDVECRARTGKSGLLKLQGTRGYGRIWVTKSRQFRQGR
jgi:ATP dependent DNA ligase-like protein